MSDIIPNIVVSQPAQLFTLARSFKANANGKVYIGEIDSDPVNPANQIPVYLENEDGSHVQVAQPIIINAGGYPVYNGQIAKFVTVQGHSMAIYDAYGALQFYFPNVLKYDPDQFSKTLSENTGASLVGTSSGNTVQQELDQHESDIEANTHGVENNISASYRDRCIKKLADVDYKVRNRIGISVLFQGDSMTAGFDTTSTDIVPPENGDWATHATTTYPERFISYLSEQSGSLPTGTIRAISGFTAKQAYENPEWQTNPNCDIAILMYGLNDAAGTAGSTHEVYLEYMEKLIKRFIDWGMSVVVMTCANGGYGSGDQKAQSYAHQIKNLSTVYGCAYFNANQVQYNRYFGAVQSDSGHFNSLGYSILGCDLATMFMAGGLMPHYRPVSSELTIWPGIANDQVGYCNPQQGVDLTRYPSAAFTFPKISGRFPVDKYNAISFSFYLDSETAEVDIVGSWSSGTNMVIIGRQGTPNPNNVSYYSLFSGQSESLAESVQELIGGAGLVLPATSNGGATHLGILSGRGWKTITFFTPQSGVNSEGFIESLTIRPIPRYLAVRQSAGSLRRGIKEVVMVSIPYRDYHPASGIPSGFDLNTVIIPLPFDLHGVSWNNGSEYFDCGSAKVSLTGTLEAGGVVYYEGLITKTAPGNSLTVTELKKVGSINAMSATIGTKGEKTIIDAGSVAPNMPLESIYVAGDDSTFTEGTTPNKYGLFLKLNFTWTGTPPHGYFNIAIESFARGLGGAATLSAM
ncbi:hypothetical protein WAS61_000567 [Citrobacter freundii]